MNAIRAFALNHVDLITARRRLGRLRDNRVGPATLKRYHHAVSLFLGWLAACRIAFAETWSALDNQIGWYLESLWEEGGSRNLAGDTLSGVQFFLLTKRQLTGSWSLFSAWSRLELPGAAGGCQRPPWSTQWLGNRMVLKSESKISINSTV